MQEGLPKRDFSKELVICSQTFLWNPLCENHGCDLRPDNNYYPKKFERIGPMDDFITDEQRKELVMYYVSQKDKRTNPYNPICFRCGKRWGLCADYL